MEITEDILKDLKTVYNILDDLKYECSGRTYTVESDEMSRISFCKDIIELILMEFKKNDSS